MFNKNFVHYFLHESEMNKIAYNFQFAYTEAVTVLEGLDSGKMCTGFTEHLTYIKQWGTYHALITGAITHAHENEGKTGYTPAEVDATMTFVKKSWTYINKHLKCFINNSTGAEAESAQAEKDRLEYLLVQQTHHHSVFCHFNLLQKKVWTHEIFTETYTQSVSDACVAGLDSMHASAAAIDVAESRDKVSDFFNKWHTCDDSLYDDRLNVDKRFWIEYGVHYNMYGKFRQYHLHGQDLLDDSEEAPTATDVAIGTAIVDDAMDFFWACPQELLHIWQRLTPKYRADTN
jgi:hypothetical protein